MAYALDNLPDSIEDFLSTRAFGALNSIDDTENIHTAVVGFHFDMTKNTIRIISQKNSKKVKNITQNNNVSLSQIRENKWLSFIGTATIKYDEESIKHATDAYTVRYEKPSENPDRVAIEISVKKILGNA
jgi:general stress protein 26